MTRTATHRVQAKWTPERVERLRGLHAQGFATSIISKMLSVEGAYFSRCAVIGKLTRLGLMGSMDAACKRARAQANARQTNRTKRAKGSLPSSTPNPRKPTDLYFAKGAERGDWNVRFCDRRASQCPRFVENEEGARGFVCGRPVASGSWCSNCGRACFQQPKIERAA